jgi:hypothetical protein
MPEANGERILALKSNTFPYWSKTNPAKTASRTRMTSQVNEHWNDLY